ncbi:MAG: ABC transporter permease [Prevotella sp.]|nr:ABC transporter permease [Prevotella sp.]
MDPKERISHISPKRNWFDVDIKGLWHYRDLYTSYIRRDFVTTYKQTILGPLWYFISPIFTTIMYMFVFGGLAGISTDGLPQPLFYMAGVTLWGYFLSCFGACTNIFGSNAGVFSKVYFPRLIVPLSSCTTNLIRYGIQMLMFLGVYAYYVISGKFEISVNWTLLLFPVYVLMVAFIAMAMGLVVSSLTTKYRDLNFLVGFGTQLLMYGTPIIYPLSFAPENYRALINLNPLTPIFEAYKYAWLGSGTFTVEGLIGSGIFLVVTLVLAVLIFNQQEQKFIDTV